MLFSFQPMSIFDMEKEIQNIDLKKATTKNTIPPKLLKVSCNTSAETLQNFFNECLITDNFFDNLTHADITPVFKKNVLPSIPKTFEKHKCSNEKQIKKKNKTNEIVT